MCVFFLGGVKMLSPRRSPRQMVSISGAALGAYILEVLRQVSPMLPLVETSALETLLQFYTLPLLTTLRRSGGRRSLRSTRFQSKVDLNAIRSLCLCVCCQPTIGTWASAYTSLGLGSAFKTQRLLK